MGKITLHIDCTYDWHRAAQFLAQDGIDTAFLLNAGHEQVEYTLAHVTGIVVVRVYDPFNERSRLGDNFEKDIVFRHEASAFVSWLNNSTYARFKGNKRVRFILGWNEMYYSGADYQRRQNDKMQAIGDALVKNGYGVALFGLAADKTIQMQDAESGVWASVITWLKANRDWAHLDVHEYELGRMAGQHLKSYPIGYPQAIHDPHSMRYENWGKIDYSGDGIKGNWHLGRVAWLGNDFPYAQGETGTDYKSDGALEAYLPSYLAKFGVKPQGFPSLRPLYNHLMGKVLSDKEFCEEIYKDLSWFAAQDPNCLSFAVFAWNKQPEHQPFNLGKPEFAHLLELLGKQQATPVPPAAPDPTPTPEPSIPMIAARIRSKAIEGTRLRQTPQNGAILGIIPNTWISAKIQADYAITAWPKIEALGLSGYAAKEWLDIEIEGMEKLYAVQVGEGVLLVPKESLEDMLEYQIRLAEYLRKKLDE